MKFIVNNKVTTNIMVNWRFVGHKAVFASYPAYLRNNVERYRSILKLDIGHAIEILSGELIDVPDSITVKPIESRRTLDMLEQNCVTYTTTIEGQEPTRHGEDKLPEEPTIEDQEPIIQEEKIQEDELTTTTTTITPVEYTNFVSDSIVAEERSVPKVPKNTKHNPKRKLRKKTI